MSTLNELNLLRTAAGMKPLKAWKESKAKLADAIKKLLKPTVDIKDVTSGALPVTAAIVDPKASSDKAMAGVDAALAKAKPAPTKTKATSGTVKATSAKNSIDGVSISTIAKELGIDPKVARAKLRRQDEVPCIEGSQWLFNKSDVPTIKKILQGDARKKV